jgi:hypothetical protein
VSIEPGDSGRGAGEADGAGEGVLILRGLNDGGAGGDGPIPAGEESRMASDLPAQCGFVDDVLRAFEGNGSDGGAGAWMYGDELVGDGECAFRNAGGKLTTVRQNAVFEYGEPGFGVEFFDFFPLHDEVAGDVGVEENVGANRADQLAGQPVAIGEDKDIGRRLGLRFGGSGRRIGGGMRGDGHE